MRTFGKTVSRMIAAIAAAICAAAFCGCAWVGDALKALTPDETEEPFAAVTPTAAATEDDFSVQNPVFTLLSDFFRVFEDAGNGMHDAALQSGEECARLYSEMLSDAAVAAKLRSTVGLLAEGDERGSYSGTFSGAYAGSGAIDLRNAFEYRFDSGEELTGTLSGGTELHAVFSGGSEYADLILIKSGDGYVMIVTREGISGALELSPGSLEYARCPEEDIGDAPGIPDGAVKLVCSEGTLKISE